MDFDELLEQFRCGKVSAADVKREIMSQTFVDAGCAKIDHHRALRKNCPEVVYCQGKTPDQVVTIFQSLVERHGNALGTRAAAGHARAVCDAMDARYDAISGLLTAGPAVQGSGKVVVVSAGTSDLSVAEEAAGTAEFLGSVVERHYDCGVAGIHRLFSIMDAFVDASAVVVVAGMDGVLPSIVGGVCAPPVIAVPTSVGYGASFGGLAALLTMLNACAPGVAVVNIDNGFGAGYMAHMINRQNFTTRA